MSMPFLSRLERTQLQAISRLAYCNPFLPERSACERAVLGADFVEGEPVGSYRPDKPGPRANIWHIQQKLEAISEKLRSRLLQPAELREPDLVFYEDCVLHMLNTRY